jgi:hypothetical protein
LLPYANLLQPSSGLSLLVNNPIILGLLIDILAEPHCPAVLYLQQTDIYPSTVAKPILRMTPKLRLAFCTSTCRPLPSVILDSDSVASLA